MNASPINGLGLLQGVTEGLKGGILAFNTQQQLALERAKLAQELEEKKLSLESQKERDVEGEARQKRLIDYALPGKIEVAKAMAGLKPTEAQKALDRNAAEAYVKDVVEGGGSTQRKAITQLEEAENELKGDKNISGPVLGLLPNALKNIVAPQAVNTQQKIENALQSQLKATLGAQFTEKEGAQLMSRIFNPQQSEAENLHRLENFKTELQQAREAKDAANKYFEQNGTLKGFKGKLYKTGADFSFDKPKGILSKEKITVSNGKETLQIDPSDLEAAQKDGYRQVK